jgi:hypothetical protein
VCVRGGGGSIGRNMKMNVDGHIRHAYDFHREKAIKRIGEKVQEQTVK